jgi:hypothetical protein
MSESHATPEFWICLVENSLELDWSQAYVPRDGLTAETAIALAERLSMQVEIDAAEYVFFKARISGPRAQSGTVFH